MSYEKEDMEREEMQEDRMERIEKKKEIDFRIWRINFWESRHIIPTAFDIIDEYASPLGT